MAQTREEAIASGKRVELVLECISEDGDISITSSAEPTEETPLWVFATHAVDHLVAEVEALSEPEDALGSDTVFFLTLQIEGTLTKGIEVRSTATPPEEEWAKVWDAAGAEPDPAVQAAYRAWTSARRAIEVILNEANGGRPKSKEGIISTTRHEDFLAGRDVL